MSPQCTDGIFDRDSWTSPAAVIFVVPIALVGVLLALINRGYDSNLYTQVGLVLMIALASKNAILIVEFARDLHREGLSITEATVLGERLGPAECFIPFNADTAPGVRFQAVRRNTDHGLSPGHSFSRKRPPAWTLTVWASQPIMADPRQRFDAGEVCDRLPRAVKLPALNPCRSSS